MNYILYIVIIILSGCAGKIYVIPEGTPVVKVTFQDEGPKTTFKFIRDYNNSYDCSEPRQFIVTDKIKEYEAKLDTYYTVSYFTSTAWASKGEGCQAVYAFKIKKGYEYLFQTKLDSGYCGVFIGEKELGSTSEWALAEDIVKRNWSTPFSFNGPWCDADDKYIGTRLP